MKRLFILLLILVNLSALGQTTVTADRVVANRGFYLKDRWVDSIGVDTTMNGEIRSLPSSDAVHRLVHYRHTALQKALNDSAAALRISLSSVSSLPSMTGNAGKYLTTDGTTASWGTVSGSATTTTALTDVSDAVPSDNSTLVYNQDSAKYVPTQTARFNWTNLQDGDLIKAQISGGDTTFVNFTPDYGSGSADSIKVTGTTDRAGFEFRPSDTTLLVTYGGTVFAFKQGGGGSTSTAPTLESLTFPTNVGLVENTGVWQGTINNNPAGYYDNYGLFAKKLAAGQEGYIEFQYYATDGENAIIAFNTTNNNESVSSDNFVTFNYEAGAYISGGTLYKLDNNTNTAVPSYTAVVGNWYRVEKTLSGGVATYKIRTHAGGSVSDVTTLTFAQDVDLYINIAVNATNKLYYPKGYNLQ
jgi:hypothetical protein